MVSENIKHKLGRKFFPLIIFLFIFILGLNIIGLVPFSFALTGRLIVTTYISLSVFIGINIIGFQIHGLKIFSLFLPAGTCSPLYFLVAIIEIVSYCFKSISLFYSAFRKYNGRACFNRSYFRVCFCTYGKKKKGGGGGVPNIKILVLLYLIFEGFLAYLGNHNVYSNYN